MDERVGSLWRRWVVATTAGEFLGFGVPAVVGGLALALSLPEQWLLAIMPVAGMGEGAILALAQWLVLRSVLPGMGWRHWTLYTALAAGLAYILDFLPANIGDISRFHFHPAALVVGGAVLGMVFLLSIGGAQWLVLRHFLPRAGWWIIANAVAWPLGVAVPVVVLSTLPDGATPVVWVAAALASGLAMGAVVGTITGLTLTRLIGARPRSTAAPMSASAPAA